MYENKKVLVWLGCGNVASNFLNIKFNEFDEVIFVDGLKHVCWEVECFAQGLECSTTILNNVVAEFPVDGTFYETLDGKYSYFAGQESKKFPHVETVNTHKVKSIGFTEILNLIELTTSYVSVICEIPSLSNRFCQFMLDSCDTDLVESFYLSEWSETSIVSLASENDSLLRAHHFIRGATSRDGDYCVTKYHFSKYEFNLFNKNEEIRRLRESNQKLSELLEKNRNEQQLLFGTVKELEEIINKKFLALNEKTAPLMASLSELLPITQKINDISGSSDNLTKTLESIVEGVAANENAIKNHVSSEIQTKVGSLQTIITKSHTNTCKQIEDFFSVRDYIDNGNKPLSFHGWPISPDVSLSIVSLLSSGSYSGVLEFGSGTSTALIGRVLKRIASDSVPIPFYSFDHNAHYFEKTKELLTLHEVSDYVDLNCCELIKEEHSEGVFQYYACRDHLHKFAEKFKGSGHRLLVLVDGPPGATNLHARYPALPVIMEEIGFDNFSVDFLVDDYGRREEKEVVEKWKKDVEQAGFEFTNEIIASEKGFCIFRVSSNL
ncbi:hypothetical protein GTQ48_11950 [Alteromonas genovensis]|uniref:Uncharacterized protein n=1 Tax=Alteromonas genovensis TaxID=471225 RepID=A0A6N9TIC6_9ALTE|nr:hypothetical protein [Alteromonas genovensis]NDW16232.1 hypothetical protein [Alteromonas genovensis]